MEIITIIIFKFKIIFLIFIFLNLKILVFSELINKLGIIACIYTKILMIEEIINTGIIILFELIIIRIEMNFIKNPKNGGIPPNDNIIIQKETLLEKFLFVYQKLLI